MVGDSLRLHVHVETGWEGELEAGLDSKPQGLPPPNHSIHFLQ